MADTEERLRRLENEIDDLRSDLCVLRSLMDQDHGSALNKIRYVTEKVLHQLCNANEISWGKTEPTLENMIGPLIAGKIIPRNVAIHVRTVQTNASPGSHFQETPLGATHVNVAQIALLEFLEWYHGGCAAPSSATGPNRVPESQPWSTLRSPATGPAHAVEADRAPSRVGSTGARRRLQLAAGAGVIVVGVIFVLAAWRPWSRSAAAARRDSPPVASSAMGVTASQVPSASKIEPTIGLRALDVARTPKGAEISLLGSESFWESAAHDFDQAAAAPGAPVRWRAGQRFSHGAVHMARGEYAETIEDMRAASTIDPTWSLPHATMAAALAETGKIDDALEHARTAESLDPTWPGAVMTTARVQAHAGHLDAAIQEYRRALTAAPKDPVLLGELALTLHAARLDSEADRFAREALDLDSMA